MSLPSLELNWLSRIDKNMSIPKVVFAEEYDTGGGYYPPTKCQVVIDDKWIDCDKGIMVICCYNSMENSWIPTTLAHEWRHHCQYERVDLVKLSVEWYENENYWESVFNYFESSITELDSLLFEHKMYPSDRNEFIIENLIRRKKLRNLLLQRCINMI